MSESPNEENIGQTLLRSLDRVLYSRSRGKVGEIHNIKQKLVLGKITKNIFHSQYL